MKSRIVMVITVAVALQAAPALAADKSLDYGFFKTRVEPIFLQKRPDHVRCYVRHAGKHQCLQVREACAGQHVLDRRTIAPKLRGRLEARRSGNTDASQLLRQPSRSRRAATRTTREAGSLRRRTTRSGKSWPNGSMGKKRRPSS